MSKYTTKVRDICESRFMYYPDSTVASCAQALMPLLKECTDGEGNTYYRLMQGTGAASVDCVLEYSWDHVFNPDPPDGFFNATHYPVLCRKILRHYYMREIGCETVGLWTLWLNTRMDEITPYYANMYKSLAFEFDPFKDVDITREHTRGDKTEETGRGSVTGQSDNTYSQGTTDKYSDTPQGSVSSPVFDNYLTNARKGDITGQGHDESQQDEDTYRYTDASQTFSEHITGKQGTGSFSKMLLEYRKSLVNVDMLVIREFSDLFMTVW